MAMVIIGLKSTVSTVLKLNIEIVFKNDGNSSIWWQMR